MKENKVKANNVMYFDTLKEARDYIKINEGNLPPTIIVKHANQSIYVIQTDGKSVRVEIGDDES